MQSGLKLTAVSRHVPAATLSAVERGRMIPSLVLVDHISDGLNLPRESLYLPLFAATRDPRQRDVIMERLLSQNKPPILSIQNILRTDENGQQMLHSRLLLAKLFGHRNAHKRGIVILSHLKLKESNLRGPIRIDIASTLGKFYLCIDAPQKALSHLLEAVNLRPHNKIWEAAMCNLGLTWWKLGQYQQAELQWIQTIDNDVQAEPRAHAYFGLGNVALRDQKFVDAAKKYSLALDLYVSINSSTSIQLRVLNNLLVCYVHLQLWQEAQTVLERGNDLDLCDSESRGAWLATQAEWAWKTGRQLDAKRFKDESKATLGTALVMSWFTVRLLELKMDDTFEINSQELLNEIDEQIERLSDQQLAASLHVAVLRNSLDTTWANHLSIRLQKLETLLPLIG